MNNIDILSAMSGIKAAYVEDTAAAMGYMGNNKKGSTKIWRIVLIAAVITLLMTAAAFASGLLGRKDREAELPPNVRGETRSVFIPNGFKESPTYRGSAEWWTEVISGFDERSGIFYNPEFEQEDEESYLISQMYFVQSTEMLERLYEIAEKYSLRLYKDKLSFTGMDTFYELTGVKKFISLNTGPISGYVFEDASFKAEFTAEAEGDLRIFTIHKIKTGSIYPFQSIKRDTKTLMEENYVTAQGEPVFISLYSDGTKIISYVSPDGESYIEISVSDSESDIETSLELCRKTADLFSFSALCSENSRAAEILSQPRWTQSSGDTINKIREYEESPAYMAAMEFQNFFTENFYGFCFIGTYGMDGYEDIDAELSRLGDKYGLNYARIVTKGNEFSPEARVYDNGAWYFDSETDGKYMQYHYIPKTALYTGLIHYTPIAEYKRCWEYETACGEKVLLFSEGPDKKSGPYAFYETDSAYVLVQLSGIDVGLMEKDADSIDWRRFK